MRLLSECRGSTNLLLFVSLFHKFPSRRVADVREYYVVLALLDPPLTKGGTHTHDDADVYIFTFCVASQR